LLAEGLLDPLGLENAVLTAPQPGAPNFSTGGLVMTIDDLLSVGTGLLRDHIGITAAGYETMTTLDAAGFGPGAFGFCPCAQDATGETTFSSIGNYGGTSMVAYVPKLDLVVAFNLSEGLFAPGRFEAASGLIAELATIAGTPA
jgi:hypothetical protein